MACRRVLQSCCAALILVALQSAGHAQRKLPDLVPHGWSTQHVQGRRNIIKYVSPDGQSVLTLRDIPSQGASTREAFASAARRTGGRVTYTRVARSWFVISGYRGHAIFYLRADRACDARRWHIVELTYPQVKKIRMDPAVNRVSHAITAYRNVCPDNNDAG